MMKKIYIVGSLMAAMSLVSCDNIAPEDRYIDVERNHSEKVVLLDEFVLIVKIILKFFRKHQNVN